MNEQHWRLANDTQNILWLTLDRQGASVNTISREVFEQLDQILTQVAQGDYKGLVIQSGKKKGFIAGADINQFTDLKTEQEAFELIRASHQVLDKLEKLPIPTVALIQGFCLGGGYELALACDYRIAEDEKSTVIGLPEVKLGIQPGWGGTVRLTRLVGVFDAMRIMLPGRAVPAKKAARMGMIDAAVPLRILHQAAVHYVLNTPKKKPPSEWATLANVSFIRPLVGKMLRKQLSSKVQQKHYPAPYAIVDCWVRDGAAGEQAYINEAKSIAQLMMTDTSRNLVRVFFLQERLKSLAKADHFAVKHVHVIGAGTMGGDIAAWCALKGFTVTLQDQAADKIAPAFKRAYKLYQKKLRKPNLITNTMDRLQADVAGEGIAKADFIIEAVFEDLNVKHAVLKDIEAKAKSSAVIATNTSSIPLNELAIALRDPSRLVGVHFFNPVAKMMLVEVVNSPQTAPNMFQQALAFVGKIGKLPLPVASRPGFLVNRVLMPYLMEAMVILQEGVSKEAIDQAALDFGMPMGPVQLADTVGLDVCLSVAENLSQHFPYTIPEALKQMVKAGKLGVKSGEGFYRYDKGKKVAARSKAVNLDAEKSAALSDRLVGKMLAEAQKCLQEQVVSDADLLDAGMIFGTGFAPFRGGPMHYLGTYPVPSEADNHDKSR